MGAAGKKNNSDLFRRYLAANSASYPSPTAYRLSLDFSNGVNTPFPLWVIRPYVRFMTSIQSCSYCGTRR
jgi:hypothetical protein